MHQPLNHRQFSQPRGKLRGVLTRFIAPLLALCLGACAALPELQAPDSVPQAELDGVPFFSQRQQQCGAASLATVLAYRGVPVTAESLESRLFIPEKNGTLAIEIVAQARQHGLLAYPLAPDLNALLAEVAAGNPVLVFQNLGLSWLPQYHFAVLVGYDLVRSEVILRSGTTPRKVVPLKTFFATWRRAGAWALAVLPSSQVPVTANAARFLRAVADLEQTGLADAAMQGYLAAARHWSEDGEAQALAALGLANIAYSEGDYRAAYDWLRESLERYPAAADNWNNLAYTLLELHCPIAARRAVACARAMAPDQSAYLESEREIATSTAGMLADEQGARCGIPACP